MALSPPIADMLGEPLSTAVNDAQARTSDATIAASCERGLWQVERADAVVAEGLTYEACVAAVEALT